MKLFVLKNAESFFGQMLEAGPKRVGGDRISIGVMGSRGLDSEKSAHEYCHHRLASRPTLLRMVVHHGGGEHSCVVLDVEDGIAPPLPC